MENEIEINGETSFKFPSNIIKELLNDGRYLVISELTANWLVLTKNELQVFNLLLEGKKVVEILDIGVDGNVLSSTLAKIMARKFADISERPIPTIYTNIGNGLHIYLTHVCNIRCKHCYMYAGNKQKNELSVEKWKEILSAFKDLHGEDVTFSGGEPLMYKGFTELVHFAYSLGLKVCVLSNGLLWTDGLINNISPYIHEVQISIDGVDNESYKKVRKNDNFAKVIDTVIKLANAGIKVIVATTFTFDNLDDTTESKYKTLVENLQEKCHGNIEFALTKKLIPGRDIHYSNEENELYYKRIEKINKAVHENAQVCNFMEGHEPNVLLKNCGIGGLSIDSNGDVYCCSRTSEINSNGNILSNTLGYYLQKNIKINNSTNVDNIEPCNKCKMRYICGGGCKVELFDMDKFFKIRSPTYKEHFEVCKNKLKETLVKCFDTYYKF